MQHSASFFQSYQKEKKRSADLRTTEKKPPLPLPSNPSKRNPMRHLFQTFAVVQKVHSTYCIHEEDIETIHHRGDRRKLRKQTCTDNTSNKVELPI